MKKTDKIMVMVLVSNALATFFIVGVNRKLERKQDLKLYLKLMLGGMLFSQIQSEYLCFRNKRNMKKTLKKRG